METYDRLLKATQLTSDDAAVVIDARWEPVGGSGTRIYPPTFPPEEVDPDRKRPYIVEPRLVDGERVDTVVLDQVPSQANRIEEVVGHAVRAGRFGLAHLMLEHKLSNGRTVRVSSFTAPHRYADAYWRDSVVDGVMFDKSDIGQRLRAATADDCTALYEREPFSLLLGSWDSHRKGRTARFPRVYRSEIFGVAPEFGRRAAGRMDTHNLVGAVQNPEKATDGSGGWEHVVSEAGALKAKGLSTIGHGNIRPAESHGGVTVRDARRLASLSMAGLARLQFGDAPPAAADAAKAVLAALALLGDRLAFGGPSLWLRSGCELVLVSETVVWHQRGGRTEPMDLDVPGAFALFEYARDQATKQGLPMSDEVVRLTAGKGLAKALSHAYLASDPEAGQ
ncbi:MAG: type I-G CRISPR-associated RAMP protein Csb1/Cas7g [Pseudonocardiaceae bacterium]